MLPDSLPALHHALLHDLSPTPETEDALFALRQVVQVYRVGRTLDPATEAEQAVHVMRHLLDRLGRLRTAYGEWRTFDAPAYFDLTREQAALVLTINEGVKGVHILVHADLLLPSVQQVVALWARTGAPPRADDGASHEELERYIEQTRPELLQRWERAVAVVHAARRLLSGDADYLAANGADEERWRWRKAGMATATAPNPLATLAIAQIPTLALTIDFPLPAWRQAGRLRRLRRNRLHRDRRTRKS